MKRLFILAIILRLLVSVFYFHPDIKTYHFQVAFLKKGILNIYTYLVENKKTLPLKEEFVYFPLTYLTLGGYQAIISPILGGDFDNWLADASSTHYVRSPNAFKYLFFLKLPYLIVDMSIAWLLLNYFKDKGKAKKAFLIWLFNPFTLILIYIFGNIDTIPVALSLASLICVKKQKLVTASVFLGLAAGFKLYPVLFIPFLFLKAKAVKEKILIIVIPFAIVLLTALPVWSKAFVSSALVSGLTTRIFYPGFPIGFNETIIVGLFGMAALFFYGYLVDKNINVFNYWLALLLIIFSFAHFHIAWLAWIAPFLVILVIQKPKLSWTIFFLAAIAFLIPALYEDRSMTISLFRLYSTLYDLLPTPFSVLEKFYDPYNLQSILHSILAAGSMIVLYKVFRKSEMS